MRPFVAAFLVFAPASAATAQTPQSAPAVVEQPLFIDAIAAPEHPTAAGDSRVVAAVNLMLGMQTGIRPQFGFEVGDRSAVLFEAYYGGLFTRFASGEAVGGGARWQWRRCSPEGYNQMILAPGAGIYTIFNGDQRTILAPSLDLSWLRSFDAGSLWGWECGMSVGVGVDVGGTDRGSVGDVSPLISFFTGLRF